MTKKLSLLEAINEASPFDTKDLDIKQSFPMGKKSTERKVPVVHAYVQYYDPEIEHFGEFKLEDSYPINPEFAAPSGVGSIMSNPHPEDFTDKRRDTKSRYIDETFNTIKMLAKRLKTQFVSYNDGANYISSKVIDTLSDFSPEEAQEMDMDLSNSEKYGRYKLVIRNLEKDELEAVREKAQQSGILGTSLERFNLGESRQIDLTRLQTLAKVLKEYDSKDHFRSDVPIVSYDVTYQITTPETEDKDANFSDSGFEFEDVTVKPHEESGESVVDELVKIMKHSGFNRPSNSNWFDGTWYSTEPQFDDKDGSSVVKSIHIKGLDETEQKELFDRIIANEQRNYSVVEFKQIVQKMIKEEYSRLKNK